MQHRATGFFDRGAMGFSFQAKDLDVNGDDVYTPGERRFTAGLFTFQEVPLSNIMRLQFGLRLDVQNAAAMPNSTFTDVNLSRTSVNYSGSIGLNHRPLPGFELGHLGAGIYEKGDTELKDEIGHGGDLFMNYTFGKTSIELAGFVNYFRNFIIFTPTGQTDEPSGYAIYQYEGAEAMLMGGELSLKSELLKGLNLISTMDYVNGRRINNGSTGEFLPVIPPFRFSAELEYDFGFGWIGGKVQAVSRQDRVAPDEAITEGYTLLGFNTGFRLNKGGRHVLILRVDNALNTIYRDHLSRVESYRWFF